MEHRLLITLVTSVIAAIIPIVIWLLNKREKNLFIEKIEQQQKTHSLIEQLLQVSPKKYENQINRLKIKAIHRSIYILNQEYYSNTSQSGSFSWHELRKYFPAYKPRNFKVFFLQILYAMILINALSGVYNLIGTHMVTDILTEEGVEQDFWVKAIVISIFVLLIFFEFLFLYYIAKKANKIQFR